MKNLFRALLVIIVLLISALIIIPMFIPVDRVVVEAKQQVYEYTGRNLSIAGEPSVSVFPNLHVALNGIRLSNPDNFDGDFIAIDRLLIDIGWSSIFQGELAINAFELDSWTLRLLSDATGANNWTLGGAESSQSESTPAGSGAIDIPSDIDLSIVKWQLSNGRIERVQTDGASQVIDDINLAMNMSSLDETLSLQGSLVLQTEKLASDITVTSLRRLLAGETAKVALNFKGLNNAVAYEGDISQLGQIVRGELALGSVDLRPQLAGGNSAPADSNAQGWDASPIDLSGLIGPDIKLAISMTKLKTPWINTGSFDADLSLQEGVLMLDIEKFIAYQGEAKGQFSLNANNAALATTLAFDGVHIQGLLKDVADIDKLLGEGTVNVEITSKAQSVAAIINGLNGKVDVALADGAVLGFNLAALIKSAESAMKGNFSDVSLDKNFSAAEKTDFSSFEVGLDIKTGIATVRKLNMLSPLVRVKGEGSIDLPKQSLDLLLQSALVASAEGQGGSADAKGITIPVAVTGPWSNIKVAPKVSDAAKSKAKAYLQEQKDKLIEDKLKSEGAKKLLKGLFNR